MSRCRSVAVALVLFLALSATAGFSAAQSVAKHPEIGRSATPAEIAAWDIDVRPDFKGLPAGSGSVAKGQEVWESKCASCHGVFGEANNVYSPLVGGTTADDIKTGRVARLRDAAFPGRTTLMKVSSLSALWDYINRAMPWTQPKSLTVEEVYASTAFLLNLGGIVPDDFVLSDKNMADVQARLPNRNGKSTAHALWPGNEFGGSRVPDVKAVACMANCGDSVVASSFPDFALNSHGNLAEQNRLVGPQRGLDTSLASGKDSASSSPFAASMAVPATGPGPIRVAARSATASPGTTAATVSAASNSAAAPAPDIDQQAALNLANRHTCTACHAMDQRTVGPGFTEIARKHAGRVDYLAGKIKAGGAGVWGAIPMPAQALSNADAKTLAAWLAAGAGK